MRPIALSMALGLLMGSSTYAAARPEAASDTTRKETKNGKAYVTHRVEPGQTLYAVMRKYKTTIQALRAANPGMKDNLVAGQMVRVPMGDGGTTTPTPPTNASKEPPKTKEKPKDTEAGQPNVVIRFEDEKPPKKEPVVINPPVKDEPADKPKVEEKKPELAKIEPKQIEKPLPAIPTKSGFHRVEAGQSLYGIAVKYGVLMADIRRWNSLSSDQLRSGQEVIVSEAAYQEFLKINNLDSAKLSDAKKPNTDKPVVPPRPEDPSNSNLPEPKIANTGKRTIETGVAEVIDAMDNNNKYLALHRTAPVGSLVQVKNTNNSQSIWVKVIGKLPDVSVNKRIIIKLSARAHEKLSPNGRQFVAEISYLAE
jgi:LysM repeat protein